MGERRMLTRKVTDDDHFTGLSASAQALYLHLSMDADDDGFNNKVSIAMFKAHASVSDLESLLERRYIYQFDNGVIVIKHWRMANALRKDRYTQTNFKNELALLHLDENGAYTLHPSESEDVVADWLPSGCQVVAECLPQYKLSKDKLSKVNTSPKGDVCIESETDSPLITIPLNTGEEYPIYQRDVDEYRNLYPSVDIEQELRNMRGWCIDNPTRRKTKSGVRAFIGNWLKKEQNRGGYRPTQKQSSNPFMDLVREGVLDE